MQKKVILVLATFALGIGAYVVLSSGDNAGPVKEDGNVQEAVNKYVSVSPTSQGGATISGGDYRLQPGAETRVRIYDEVSHRLKYQFEAEVWEPISETEFHLQKLMIQSYMPGGEITYITADEAQVTLARKSRNRVEPKRGWLKGSVRVTIDRTTTEWREAHPELADRFSHPDDLIEIYLGEASFDLDQAELIAPGDIVVDGSDVRIEDVRGLTLQWNQVDNRIDVLRFAEGGKMTLLRGGDRVGFVMPGGELTSGKGSDGTLAAGDGSKGFPKARAMEPLTIETVTAEEAAAQIRMEGGIVSVNRPMSLDDLMEEDRDAAQESASTGQVALRSPQELEAAMSDLQREAKDGTSGTLLAADGSNEEAPPEDSKKRKQRVHTYRAVFENDVVVQQMRGEDLLGRLDAARLEVNFDFGKEQKALGAARGPRTAETPKEQEGEGVADATATTETEPDVRLSLVWNGPLELRPMRVDHDKQTGKRFDVVATGTPVRVESRQQDQRGTVLCQQLVYRNERRQVWLAGTSTTPVELGVDENSKLVGQQVFFDQKRGLARVDGSGSLVKREVEKEEDAVAGKEPEKEEGGLLDSSKSVEIAWSRGVDLEFGEHRITKLDMQTGLMQMKDKPFLKRAWFHGAVSVQQEDEKLTADEVAVTFGVEPNSDEMADYIQHLSTTGDVRLQRKDEIISADRIDTQMAATPDGEYVPRIVDAVGNVIADQDGSQFKADKMHVVLGMSPELLKPTAEGEGPRFGKDKLGIEKIDATGSVFALDPSQNLKISRAETLSAVMRNGRTPVHVTITSPEGAPIARARYENMAIHGQHINIDADAQSIDVPGPGQAWILTGTDFGGKEMSRPTPVRIGWNDHMAFRLAKNYGVFAGGVTAESQPDPKQSEPDSFAMACEKLTLRFAPAPPKKEKDETSLVDHLWILGPIIKGRAKPAVSESIDFDLDRKQPSYVVAEGSASIVAQKYGSWHEDGTPAQLTSRMFIAGDQIVADLLRQQMSVPGEGQLLIEDYRFHSQKERLKNAAIKTGPLMSSVGSDGPSQTSVTWKNSMDFFVDRNLVAFDKDIRMAHRSGMQLAKLDELAANMGVDPSELRHIGSGRKADLSCGHLLLEFLVAGKDDGGSDSPESAVRATDMKRLIARHAVHLQDGTKSLMGEYLQYLNDTNEVRLEGSASLEARIIDQDERTQRLNMWRGPLLIWNRTTNDIQAPKARIRSSQ